MVSVERVEQGTLLVDKTGSTTPKEFPKWRTVHAYFAIWSAPREGGSLLEQAKKIRLARPARNYGSNTSSRFLIVDAQSVKSTDNHAHRPRSTETGKPLAKNQ